MKKTEYKTKSHEELEAELATLRATVAQAVAKGPAGKNTKEYRQARKNIARALTALSNLPAVISTEVKK